MIRITAIGEERSDSTINTVSTVSRVSDDGSVKLSSARTGTDALIEQTMPTVLTQKNRGAAGRG
jgi:hypothetical protein